MLRRLVTVALGLCALCVIHADLIASDDAPHTKEEKKRAKQKEKESLKEYEQSLRSEALDIFHEGEGLESADDLHHAYLTYTDAEAKYRTKEISEAKARVRDAIDRKISNLVSNAQNLGKQGQWDAAIAALKQAQKYVPSSALLSYNLSVSYMHKGEMVEALQQIDEAIQELGPGKKRDRLEDIRGQLITNFSIGRIPTSVAPVVLELNRAVKGDNMEFRRIEHDFSVGAEPCKYAHELQNLVKIPSLTYDRGRCAELEGNFTLALNLFQQYLVEAHGSADEVQVRQDINRVKALETLPRSEIGDQVRKLYADTERYLDKRRIDLAKKSLEKAYVLLPGFSESLMQLAVLNQLIGDIDSARKYYRQFISIEQDEARRSVAEKAEARLGDNYQSYRAFIADARVPLTQVTNEFLQWRTKPRLAYIDERLERVGLDLREAASLFPLAPEVNELLSIVYLIANKQELAKRCFDVLWSQGWSISFFAAGGNRVVISEAGIAIVERNTLGFESWDFPVIPFASEFKDLPFQPVLEVRTEEGTLLIKEHTGNLTIAPALYGLPHYEKGPFPRSYANHYARIFQRYLDVKTTLGKESLTGKEIFKLALDVLEIVNYTSDFTKWYNAYLTLYWGVISVRAYTIVIDVHALLRQRQLVLQDSSFKYVPTHKSKFEIADSL